VINAAAAILVAVMLIWFGVRPATKALLVPPPPMQESSITAIEASPTATQHALGGSAANFLIEGKDDRDQFFDALSARKDKSPQRHLQRLVDYDEEHAAAILKQWIRQGASA
jgi:flagellar M-ring protein FliF